MSEKIPEDWELFSIKHFLDAESVFCDGDWVESKDQDEEGINRLIQLADIGDGVFLDKSARYMNNAQFSKLRCTELKPGDILIARMPDPLGRACLFPNLNQRCATVVDVAVLRSPKANVNWLMYMINSHNVRRQIESLSAGTTRTRISRKLFSNVLFLTPNPATQKYIADVLMVIDQTIEKTEALIEKYQHIKAGLMHDLFTRGIGADGKLRPTREQAPELYQETPIGGIPKDWEWTTLDTVKESLVDGPFGSNLKTEHYVSDPGVRVVRLQNIQLTKYNDDDKAFVSNKHADSLFRNKVIGNDILIAGLGEDRYPVGRACLYPDDLPPAINKADCFRLRCVDSLMSNGFLMYFLNTSSARAQVRKYEQGVTRPRINLGNMKKLIVPQPKLEEQSKIFEKLEHLGAKIDLETKAKNKLLDKKSGLMHDLLTGKVSINVKPKTSPETQATI